MKIIIFFSLIVALLCMFVIYFNWNKATDKQRRYLIGTSALFYLIFIIASVFYYQTSRETDSAFGPTIIKKNAEEQKNYVLDIKTKLPKVSEVGESISLELLVTNSNIDDINELMLDINQDELAKFLAVEKILVDEQEIKKAGILALGEIKTGSTKKVVLELMPIKAGTFIGEFLWLAGDETIFDQAGKPLLTVIKIEINEEDDEDLVTDTESSENIRNTGSTRRTDSTQNSGGTGKKNTSGSTGSTGGTSGTGSTGSTGGSSGSGGTGSTGGTGGTGSTGGSGGTGDTDSSGDSGGTGNTGNTDNTDNTPSPDPGDTNNSGANGNDGKYTKKPGW